MGSAAKTIGRVGAGIVTVGLSEAVINQRKQAKEKAARVAASDEAVRQSRAAAAQAKVDKAEFEQAQQSTRATRARRSSVLTGGASGQRRRKSLLGRE